MKEIILASIPLLLLGFYTYTRYTGKFFEEDSDNLTTFGFMLPIINAAYLTFWILGFDTSEVDFEKVYLGTCVTLFIVSLFVQFVLFCAFIEGKDDYRRRCIKAGLELNDYVGEFFVKVNPYYYDNYTYSVEVYRVLHNKNWLGQTLATTERVTTLFKVKHRKDISEDNIRSAVEKHFNTCERYLIKGGNELEKVDSVKTIIIGGKDA